MLMSYPKEMIDNPECFVELPNGLYEPSKTATEAERKAINDFVKGWKRAEEQSIIINE